MKKIPLQDGELEYYPEFLAKDERDRLFHFLTRLDSWRQEHIKLFGKKVLQPRLTALFGEDGKTYTYSGLEMHPESFPEELLKLKYKCEEHTGINFTTCLANLYRDGSDSMGWHSDNEKELGRNPVIASVSLGEERIFHLKHKVNKSLKHKLTLEDGSLLIMKGSTQENWNHQLPKTKRKIGPRINLTFRKIY